MNDIIKGLVEIIEQETSDGFVDGVNQQLISCALAYILDHKDTYGHWTVLEDCSNSGIYCSECNMKIFDRITKPKRKLSQYCPHCGSRNDQFFRDGEVVFR